jgi:hypothetical protein
VLARGNGSRPAQSGGSGAPDAAPPSDPLSETPEGAPPKVTA